VIGFPARSAALAAALSAALLGVATAQKVPPAGPSAFPNALDTHAAPRGPNDDPPSLLADLGAWQAFALPPDSGPATPGFVGPWLMAPGDGRWLGPAIARLAVAEGGGAVEWTTSRSAAYPGWLELALESRDLSLRLRLWFVSSRTALVAATVRNRSAVARNVRLAWEGSVWMDSAVARPRAHGVAVVFAGHDDRYEVTAPAPARAAEVAADGSAYRLDLGAPVRLGPGGSISRSLAVSLYADGAEAPREAAAIAAALREPERALEATRHRWTGYLRAVFEGGNGLLADPGARLVAVKALETLIGDWRAARGDIRHDGLFPSYTYRDFHAFWAWDSWKHAAALALFAPGLAESQIRAMFDWQDSAGMVPDVVAADRRQNNLRNTKPPLAGWAVWSVYRRTRDRAFLAAILPKVDRYHDWWYAHRDHDHDGLCEWGSTDGTKVAAAWESGMDNAVRFDSAGMLQNGPDAWSLDHEAVDLNAYLYAEKLYLADLHAALGDSAGANRRRAEAELLRRRIRGVMFDSARGYFYDVTVAGHRPIRVAGPEGWLPLWAGVADTAEAGRVLAVLEDTARFDTYLPFPTVERSDPGFSPERGYWRGPVWLDQAYFAVAGLARYGFRSEARAFAERLVHRPAGLDAPGAAIRETYDPLTGAGQNSANYGWSAAHLLLLLHDDTLGP